MTARGNGTAAPTGPTGRIRGGAPAGARRGPGTLPRALGLLACGGLGACGGSPAGPAAGAEELAADAFRVAPPILRLVGTATATVRIEIAPGRRATLVGRVEAPGVRPSGGRTGLIRLGPDAPSASRAFVFRPAVGGYVEGHWNLGPSPEDVILRVPIRATTIAGPRVDAPGPSVVDLGAVPVAPQSIGWRLRNEGGTTARIALSIAGPDARIRGAVVRPLGALTSTVVDLELDPVRPGPFTFVAEARTGTVATRTTFRGEGVAPRIVAVPPHLDLEALVGGTARGVFDVVNVGGGRARVDAVELSPGAEPAFRLQVQPRPGPWLVESAPLRVDVAFRPEAPGPHDREVRIHQPDRVISVPLAGRALACEVACPVEHGFPECGTGRCRIGGCAPGFHDVNARFEDGCECDDREDPGDTCSTSRNLGRIEERTEPRVVLGRVPTVGDIDLIRFHADDGFHVFREDFDVRVELESAPSGVTLCVFRRPTDEPRSECLLQSPTCPKDGRYRNEGRYGREDAADFIVRITGADAPPSCALYRLVVRNG